MAQCSAGPSKLGGRGYNYSIYKSKTFYIYFKRSWIAIPLTRFLNHPAALQCSGFFRISLHFFNSILHMWSPLSSLDFWHSINLRAVSSQYLLFTLLIQFKLVNFGQNNIHSTIDFFLRPARKKRMYHITEARTNCPDICTVTFVVNRKSGSLVHPVIPSLQGWLA